MILIAAIAVALQTSRAYDINYRLPSRFRFLDWMRGAPSCVVVTIAVALIPLRLRRPRPGLRRISRQPGFAACAAVALGGAIGLMLHGVHIVARLPGSLDSWRSLFNVDTLPGSEFDIPVRKGPYFVKRKLFNSLWHGAVSVIPFTVFGVWMSLAVSRRWRCGATWIDRLGRAVSTYWVGYIVLDVAAPVIAGLASFFQ